MSKYPEHEKMREHLMESQAIGEFLEWMQGERKLWICESQDSLSTPFVPYAVNINVLLAEYYEIDLDKVENEKREMLEEARRANDAL